MDAWSDFEGGGWFLCFVRVKLACQENLETPDTKVTRYSLCFVLSHVLLDWMVLDRKQTRTNEMSLHLLSAGYSGFTGNTRPSREARAPGTVYQNTTKSLDSYAGRLSEWKCHINLALFYFLRGRLGIVAQMVWPEPLAQR